MELSLSGRQAIVTGASAGIGHACATMLAESGAEVLAVARGRERLEQVVKEATSGGLQGSLTPLAADVTSEDDRMRIVEAAQTAGGPDILVNCAGGSRTLAIDADEGQWREAMEVNFWSKHRLTHAVLPGMVERGWGRIVNITGSSEPKPMPIYTEGVEGTSSLNAAMPAKAALHAWAKGVAREVARHGVTINSVPPGRIMSEQVERFYPTEEDRRAYAAERIPMGRFGDPRELAALVVFLCSEQGSYITGELVHVDGGMRNYAF